MWNVSYCHVELVNISKRCVVYDNMELLNNIYGSICNEIQSVLYVPLRVFNISLGNNSMIMDCSDF